ncbi:class I SAM-dependent methyltransferase [Chloroflexota bacterium]
MNIYNGDHYNHIATTGSSRYIWDMKVRSATNYLRLLEETNHHHEIKGRLLDVGCAQGFMLKAATTLGYDAYGLEISPSVKSVAQKEFKVLEGSLEESDLPNSYFTVVTMIDVIEHLTSPALALRKVGRALKSGGTLIIVTPDISSISSTLLRGRWPHFMPEHLCYYSTDTLKRLLGNEGYETLIIKPGFKFLNFDYVMRHFERYVDGWMTAILSTVRRTLPKAITRQAVKFQTGLICISVKSD